ncbi:MAG TPA: lysophospholipid acyltransferase family protein [Candidatus Sulfomarinibacteraceae bacterium]|nr:lysophospholipid acyltransferase family protein [Candidatus Sulfomarinibacteraceae bacterium]
MSRRRTALRNRFEFGLYRAARALVEVLSPAASARLGAAIGSAFHRLARRRRRILDFNLGLAFPELDAAARRELGREVSRHFGRVALDAMRVQRLSPDRLRAEVTVEGGANLRAALERGHGGFLLSAHLGSWEVAALAGGLLVPGGLSIIYRPLDNPLLDAELERLRGSFGNRSLGKRNVSREVIETLRAGGVVGILIDQRPRGVELEVPFFGHPAKTHPVLARFVRKTRAPVVPIFAYWDAPARYTLVFGEPVLPDQLDESELEVEPLTSRFMAITEAAIRRRPEQWLWYHDRWRTIREGR